MPVRRKATKKVPMAPVEEREKDFEESWPPASMSILAEKPKTREQPDAGYRPFSGGVKTIPRTPARSELPPAHVCTTDGSQLTFIRELSPGKRLYACSHGHGPLLFLDEV